MSMKSEEVHKLFNQAKDQGFDLKIKVLGAGLFSEIELKEKSVILRGFTPAEPGNMFKLTKDYIFQEEESEGDYRLVFINNEKYHIYTYCEGDLILEIFKDQEDYKQAVADMKNWYLENS